MLSGPREPQMETYIVEDSLTQRQLMQLFVTTTSQYKAGVKQAQPVRLFNGVNLYEIQGGEGLEFLI